MSGNSPSLDSLLAQGRLAYQTLRFGEAIDAYQRALEIAADEYQAQLGLARTLTRMRRQEEALEAAQRCVEIDPQQADGHAALGVLYFLTDDLDEASQALERAIALAPDDPEAHLTQAQVLTDRKLYAEAEERLQQARELIARVAEDGARDELLALAWHVETYLRLSQSDNTAATRAAQEVIGLQEANPYAACLAYSNLGILEAKARRYDGAIAYFEQAYTLNPYFYRAGTALGRLLIARRQYGRAADVLADAMSKAPDNVSRDTQYAYALALARSGRRQEGLAAYRLALQNGLSGVNRVLALWQTVWLHEYGRHVVIGLAMTALLIWVLVVKPSPQTMTLLAVLAAILVLQKVVGARLR
jgi:tetratricopeptide (TPR) repeat protein